MDLKHNTVSIALEAMLFNQKKLKEQHADFKSLRKDTENILSLMKVNDSAIEDMQSYKSKLERKHR